MLTTNAIKGEVIMITEMDASTGHFLIGGMYVINLGMTKYKVDHKSVVDLTFKPQLL